jgi:hypothetical protein
VLAIGGGRGFGAFMDHQLSLFGSADVTFLLTPEFGHIDHFMTPDHRELVERPVFDWLRGGVRVTRGTGVIASHRSVVWLPPTRRDRIPPESVVLTDPGASRPR